MFFQKDIIDIPHGIRIVAHEAYLMALITALGATAIYLSEDLSGCVGYQLLVFFGVCKDRVLWVFICM